MSADELAKLLDELGRRLGPAGEHVFQIALQRVIVQSLVSTVAGILLILLIGYGLIRWSRYVRALPKNTYSGDDPFDKLFPIGLAWMIGGIPILLAAIVVVASITDLFTAEFVTLRTILGAIIK